MIKKTFYESEIDELLKVSDEFIKTNSTKRSSIISTFSCSESIWKVIVQITNPK